MRMSHIQVRAAVWMFPPARRSQFTGPKSGTRIQGFSQSKGSARKMQKFKTQEEESSMKKAILFATTLALALGARAQTVNSVGNTFASDGGTISPPIIVVGPSAPKKPAPVAQYSESTLADAGTISPPIIVVGPSAPKTPAPVSHYSESTLADAGTVSPIVIGPSAPKKPGPVAHYSESTLADAGTISPPIIVVGPSAPKKLTPVARYSESV
jgi:hypothetical protein